jgi:hypothetical protein
MRVAPLLLLVALVSASAAAQRREEPYRPTAPTIGATPFTLAVAGFDRDGDLLVSRAEYDAGAAAAFSRADQDGNGRVSLIELSTWSVATLGNSGALPGQFDFDKDGDDSISRAEFMGLFGERFATLDADKDNVLKRAELISFAATPQMDRRERQRLRERLAPPQQ